MEASQKESRFLGAEPVGKLLVKFAVPCVLAMLVGALYNIVDQIFIGQSIGYLGTAATTVVYPFTVIALAIATLIGDGSASFLSLSLGGGDKESGHKSIGNGIVLTIISSLILTVIGFLMIDKILLLFGATSGSYEYAYEYMQIILIGVPFYMFTSSMNAAIRADGAPKYAMFATLLGAVLNLILDPIAIFLLGWGMRGAAIATIIGQIVSCIVTILYFRRSKLFQFQKSSFHLKKEITKRISQLGASSFITQISIVLITGIANNLCIVYGSQSIYGADIPLSALGIVFKVFGIVIAFSVGIAVGAQPIIGYNFGAGNTKRVFATYRLVLIANTIVGVVASILFLFFPSAIVRLFGSESALYNEYAIMCFRIYLSGILLCCLQKASSIFLQSIGKPVQATLLSLSRDVIFLIPGVAILAYFYNVTGMLWAGPIADVLAFILTLILVVYEIKKMRSVNTKVISKNGYSFNQS